MTGLVQHDGGPGYFYFEYELKELAPLIPARYWDGTYRDRVAEQDGYPDLCPPKFHTDASAQYSARHPVVFAQHLDTSPNVG